MSSSQKSSIEKFTVTVRSEQTDKDVIQYFFFNKRQKGIKSLFDFRYEGYSIFERMLVKYSLKETSLKFYLRQDREDCVVLFYMKSGVDPVELPMQEYFTVQTIVPPYMGCEFCKHKILVDNLNFKCDKKNKILNKEVNKCSVFQQSSKYEDR